MPPSELGIAAEQPYDIEADDLARVADERRQPATGSRRETIELRRDPFGSLELGRERLDEAVENPLMVRGEAAERCDRRDADFALVAAQPALQQRSCVRLAHRSARDEIAGRRRKHPPPVYLRPLCRPTSTRSDARDGNRS